MRRRHFARGAVLFLAVLAQAMTATAQVVETIEPPSWWVERDEQELLLLIEGSGLDGALVRVVSGPIKVARMEPGRQGHALFVEVSVPGKAEVSHCEFEIAAGGKTFALKTFVRCTSAGPRNSTWPTGTSRRRRRARNGSWARRSPSRPATRPLRWRR